MKILAFEQKILVFEQDCFHEEPEDAILNRVYLTEYFKYKEESGTEMSHYCMYEDDKIVIWMSVEVEEGDSWKFIGIK